MVEIQNYDNTKILYLGTFTDRCKSMSSTRPLSQSWTNWFSYSYCLSPFNVSQIPYSKFSERWKRSTRNMLSSWIIWFAYTYHHELLHIKFRNKG